MVRLVQGIKRHQSDHRRGRENRSIRTSRLRQINAVRYINRLESFEQGRILVEEERTSALDPEMVEDRLPDKFFNNPKHERTKKLLGEVLAD
jgi:hypothetical protein